MDIQNFIAEFKKTFVYDLLSMTLKDEQLFEHVVDGDAVLWFKEQTRQMWLMWEKAQAQAVPEWISVQDRMPEQGQKVLVFRPDAHNHPHKDPNFKICTYAGADIFINSHFEHVITHWKPLESPIEAQEPAND
jgi:hypothetical protein